MAEDSRCLKRLCIAFSVIYGILGVVTLVIGILASSFSDEAKDFDTSGGIIMCCVSGSLVLLLALLGVFGAYKEKKWALRVYIAFLILHAIGCFRGLAATSSTHSEINGLEAEFRKLKPLNQADEKTQNAIKKLQTEAECCGLLSYEDWDPIPQSCHCLPDYEDRASKCQKVQQSRDSSAYMGQSYGRDTATSEVEVYKEPCGPILLKYAEMGIRFAMGVLVTFLVVLVISTILHLTLNYMINNPAAVIAMTVRQDPEPPQYTAFNNQLVKLCPQ